MSEWAGRVDLLSTVPLFAGLSVEALKQLAGLLQERRYPRNARVCSGREPGDAMFIVCSGVVKVWIEGEGGHEVVLDTLGKDGFFGEMSLLDDVPRSAHVSCLTEAVLLRLGREDFQGLLEAHPNLSINLMSEFVARLRHTTASLRKLPPSEKDGERRGLGRKTPAAATLSEAVAHAPGSSPLTALAGLETGGRAGGRYSGKERMKFLSRFLEEEIPFHRIIGVRVVALSHGACTLRLPYQHQLVGDPLGAMLHGSAGAVLAEGAALGASYALMHNYEDRLSTVSLSMTYARPAPAEDLYCEAHVVRFEHNMIMTRMALYAERLPVSQAGEVPEPLCRAEAIFSVLNLGS